MGNVRFFCKPRSGMAQIAQMARRWPITMILSENAARLDTRFGTAADRLNQLESLTGHPVMTTPQEAERTGPIDHFGRDGHRADHGERAQTSWHWAFMTRRSRWRLRRRGNQKPLVLGIASNDFLGISGVNLMRLKQMASVFRAVWTGTTIKGAKPNSLVKDWSLTEAGPQGAL